jgi:hypothetical protein
VAAASAGDVPDQRRQAAQGRAAPDRRRDRQRGRPAPQDFGRSRSGRTSRWSSCPRTCPSETFRLLEQTRISGKLIELAKDKGPGIRSSAPNRGYGDRPSGGGYKGNSSGGYQGDRKPRHKD